MRRKLLILILLFCCIENSVLSWSLSSEKTWFSNLDRREFNNNNFGMICGSSPFLVTAFGSCGVLGGVPDAAQAATVSLGERLSQRDPSVLSNSIFNVPPSVQVYPQFMRGSWDVTLKYAGYIFPSQKIPRSKLTTNPQIPGFQKCSIASLSDVGKEIVHYKMNIDEVTGLEDRKTSLMTSINDHLGYSAVQEVLYTPQKPNRISIVFVGYKTTNAERIELFCNGRESELIIKPSPPPPAAEQQQQQQESNSNSNSNNNKIFVCSEFIRQVTFSGGSEVGTQGLIPRQVGTNYAHFWTWKESDDGTDNNNNIMTGNLLTACYLDPQDAMFFEEPSKPVAVFSHVIKAEKNN